MESPLSSHVHLGLGRVVRVAFGVICTLCLRQYHMEAQHSALKQQQAPAACNLPGAIPDIKENNQEKITPDSDRWSQSYNISLYSYLESSKAQPGHVKS